MPMFTEPHGQRSACFASVASATFTGNATDALCRLLLFFLIYLESGRWTSPKTQYLCVLYTIVRLGFFLVI
jgi:hypothetical protein